MAQLTTSEVKASDGAGGTRSHVAGGAQSHLASRSNAEQLTSLDPRLVAAATSKLFAASIGDMVVVLARSPAHKHHSLADIEWMVLPPASRGQFYVAEYEDEARGFRAPIALVTWAFVSQELDQRLTEPSDTPKRLRPDEWKCGDIAWLVGAVGAPAGVTAALQWLRAGAFRDRPLKIRRHKDDGASGVSTLAEWSASRVQTEGACA